MFITWCEKSAQRCVCSVTPQKQCRCGGDGKGVREVPTGCYAAGGQRGFIFCRRTPVWSAGRPQGLWGPWEPTWISPLRLGQQRSTGRPRAPGGRRLALSAGLPGPT